jgi:hypothetical protein
MLRAIADVLQSIGTVDDVVTAKLASHKPPSAPPRRPSRST